MAGRSGGLLSAGLMVVLTLGGSACSYDRSSAPNGPTYGDTAKMSAVQASAYSIVRLYAPVCVGSALAVPAKIV